MQRIAKAHPVPAAIFLAAIFLTVSLPVSLTVPALLAAPEVAAGEEPQLPVGLEGSGEEPQLPAGLEGSGEEPELPAGLEGSGEEPQLPMGLEASAAPASPQGPEPGAEDEPALPSGLDVPPGSEGEEEEPAFEERSFRAGGFAEARAGGRLRSDEHERSASLLETRLQLDLEGYLSGVVLRLKADFLYDDLADDHDVELERGKGWIDLREANLLLSPGASIDIKAGRQILTWGTGDLLFINDLFPKDFQAFFSGRDREYLKAPSDAAKLTVSSRWINLDAVYSPRFDGDRAIDGSRFSYYHPGRQEIVGRDAIVFAHPPDDAFADDEWALRMHGILASYELALYLYDGFWKSPAGTDPATGRAIHPRLRVRGFSLRGPLGPGILSAEAGHYDSLDDPAGDDPFLRNSEARALLGYEWEAAPELTVGMQYYGERLIGHDRYRAGLPAGAVSRDEQRGLWTIRLTWLTLNQDLIWSGFSFFSPTERDAYHRLLLTYRLDDHWSSQVGANVFEGRHRHTFFGQFQDNSNAFAALRYGF